MNKTPKRKDVKRQDDEETELKRKRQSEVFLSFFQKIEKPAPPPTLPFAESSLFKAFQIKEGTTLGPIFRRPPLTTDELNFLANQRLQMPNYLSTIKSRKLTTATNTKPMKAKLFVFHDNYRPPYYGTWRWKSKKITGRKPFLREENNINYDYDSDQDWEEEPSDAEECRSDDDDEPENDEMDDDENDGFFVDHGYLSNDEGSDDGSETVDVKSENDDQRKNRLKQRAEEWKENQRQKERRFKQRKVIPNIYITADNTNDNVHNPQRRFILPGVIFDYSKLDALKICAKAI